MGQRGYAGCISTCSASEGAYTIGNNSLSYKPKSVQMGFWSPLSRHFAIRDHIASCPLKRTPASESHLWIAIGKGSLRLLYSCHAVV
jgi:hypothetical protein